MTNGTYTSVYTGKEKFFQDHVVRGEKILPGVAYLELACAAGERVSSRKITQLKNVVWQSPVKIGNGARKISIRVFEQKHELKYEVYSKEHTGNTIHSHGEINHTTHVSPHRVEGVTSVRSRLTKTKTKQQCYDLFTSIGLSYGPSFRGIDFIQYDSQEALSKITLPRDEQYILSPGLLDSALQTCIAFRFDRPDYPFTLPFSIEEINIYSNLPSSFWCHVRKRNSNHTTSLISGYDIMLIDDNGEVFIEFKNYVTLPVERHGDAVGYSQGNQKQNINVGPLFIPQWSRLNAPEQTLIGAKHLIVKGPGHVPFAEMLKTTLIRLGAEAEVVEDLTTLQEAVTDIYLCQGLTEPPEPTASGKMIMDCEGSVFRTLKTIQAFSSESPAVNITVFIAGTQKVLPSDTVSPSGAGIIGLIGSVSKENTHWNVRLIDLPFILPSTSPLEALLNLPFEKEVIMKAYRFGHFYKKALYPIQLPEGFTTRFKTGGCYVLLGGAGGLGRVTTEYLVRKYNAEVIWLGRREQDKYITASQDAVTDIGKKPLYIQCNVNSKQDVERAFQEIKALGKSVHGLFHAGIVLKDARFEKMTEREFHEAFDVKSIGISHFVEVFKTDPLDFICIYSSLQSQWTAPGQSNYAAGCTYIDSYAFAIQDKLNIPVRVINWGYWGEVGIVSTPEYKSRMDQIGIGSIGAEDGMRHMESILAFDQRQVTVIKFTREISSDFKHIIAQGSVVYNTATPLKLVTPVAQEYNHNAEAERILSEICHKQLLKTLLDLGLEEKLASSSSIAALRNSLGIIESYQRLFNEIIRTSLAYGTLKKEGDLLAVPEQQKNALHTFDLASEIHNLTLRHRDYTAHAGLLALCFPAYNQILKGKVSATDIIFPEGKLEFVGALYKNNYQADYFNGLLAESVRQAVAEGIKILKPGEKINILEVGAGTGGTSEIIFRSLAPYQSRLHYCYSDLSKTFLMHAERFKDIAPYLETSILNIEASPLSQGFKSSSFDIIIGANVLHSVKDIAAALQNIKTVLKKNGLIILNELAQTQVFTSVVFGLLDGWWRFEDGPLRLEGGPALSATNWKYVLSETGFDHPESYPEHNIHSQQIIIAKSNGLAISEPVVHPAEQEAKKIFSATTNNSSYFVNDSVSAKRVLEIVAEKVATIIKMGVDQIDLDRPMSDYGVDSIMGLSLIRELNKYLDAAIPTTILFDYPTVNLLGRYLYENYAALFARKNVDALPGNATIEISAGDKSAGQKRSDKHLSADVDGKRISITSPGEIDNLIIEEFSVAAPGPDEITVAVQSFSLNFGDLLCIKGLYPNMPPYPFTPGFEAAGIVKFAGENIVDYHPGDEVMLLSGQSLGLHSTHVTVTQDCVFNRPKKLSASQACAMPVITMTMLEAFRRAYLKEGETILIQTATGGIGLIGVQLAKHKGAKIIATAGSQKKLDYLKSLGINDLINYVEQDLEAEIKRLTNGRGVDVVINTLAGDQIQKGINCLGKRGRYIELSMTAIKSARGVDLSKFSNNQTFIGVDLAKLISDEPGFAKPLWEECIELIDNGILSPTISHQFDFLQYSDACKTLENRQNIGKVVVNVDHCESVQHPLPGNSVASFVDGSNPDDIAVIGMSGQFGATQDLTEFWEVLKAGKSLIEEVPSDRWDTSKYFSPVRAQGKTYGKWGSFLRDIDKFDPVFFKISGVEAELMDPQQRLFLEHCWKAIEDAAINPQELGASKCSVYVGAAQGDYLNSEGAYDASAFWGNSTAVLASRISYYLNLKGPAVSVDTACSSSLVAMDLGCKSLQHGESDIVITGGVSIFTTPEFYIKASQAGMLSPQGICFSFDERADGFVPGEGVGVLILKRLKDALKDGDNIHGVIKGSLTNQDGTTNGIIAPSILSQTGLEKEVYEKSGISPESISYVEAHGTGTSLGDPIEFEALTNAFRSFTNKKQYCSLGSVKTNIGHTVMAAGVAGVIKILLCLKHGQLVPSLNFKCSNKLIDFRNSPFKIQEQLQKWVSNNSEPLRAAVSSFGFSGTNAHVVIEEYRPEKIERKYDRPMSAWIILSAKDQERLCDRIRSLLSYLRSHDDVNLDDLAFTLQTGREAMESRLAVETESMTGLIASLDDFLVGNVNKVYTGTVRKDHLSFLPEDGSERIQEALRKGDFRQLIHLWIGGSNVQWSKMYGKNRLAKLNLPPYIFARQHYWKKRDEKQIFGKNLQQRIHPLLHTNTSDLYMQKFRSVFFGDEFFLADHLVRNTKVLPGVAYIEMARQAGFISMCREVTQIRNVKWIQPLKISRPDIEIIISLSPQEDKLLFKVTGNAIDEVYCSAEIITQPLAPIAKVDLSSIRKRCRQSCDSKRFYNEFASRGLVLGTSYQTIKSLEYNDEEALARVAYRHDDGFRYSPGLLDGVLQTYLGINMDDERRPVGLPYSVRQIDLHRSVPEGTELWVYARKQKQTDTVSPTFTMDMVDADGNVYLTFTDFVCMPASETSPSDASEAKLSIYGRTWYSKEAVKTETQREQLIFLADESFVLAEKLSDALAMEVLPILGKNEVDYFECVFNSIQNRINQQSGLNIIVLYKNSEFIDFSFLSGLVKTASIENGMITGKLLGVEDLSITHIDELVEILTVEQLTNDNEVRYITGCREVKGFKSLNEVTAEQSQVGIRNNGVYLIAGAGVLGRSFAQYLSRNESVRIILAGRRALDDETQRFLASVPHAEYYRCDVTDSVACDALIESIVKKHKKLNGILHCAGVIHDSLIINKKFNDIRNVLAAKIRGTKNLDKATANENLDFVIYFSSLSGLTGNLGQADYSAANAYLDNYAAFRNALCQQGLRKGYTISIGWPLWQQGGMMMNENGEHYSKKQFGLLPLPSEAGFEAFEKLLCRKISQATVLFGESDRLLAFASTARTSTHHPRALSLKTDEERTALVKKAEQKIIDIAHAIVKLPKSNIKPYEELGSFGFDSIMLTRFSHDINSFYGIDLMPTVFYNYPTIERLAAYLTKDYAEQLSNTHNHAGMDMAIDKNNTVAASDVGEKFRFSGVNDADKKVSNTSDRFVGEPIAIIGISCRFPGSPDAESFWENIKENRDLITPVPASRWDWTAFYGEARQDATKTKAKWGGFISDIDKFDPAFFSISPRESILMDPQQRIVLECVHHALEDAGLPQRKIRGTNTGVFIGVSTSDYSILLRKQNKYVNQALFTTGSAHSVLVNRISYAFDLHGPSEPIDTACSSSLIAIHRAIENIRNGNCDIAIAGGVNALLAVETTLSFSNAGMLSEDGRCKTFDQDANGYVRGEGVGVVILKTLSKAERDGNRIYATIKASSVNHGGKANTFTSPNPQAQKDLIVNAYTAAAIDPRDISYIEAHGTGTPLGDPVETEGLKLAFDQLYKLRQIEAVVSHCGVGSVKANIGHLEAAAGIAGIIKVVLSLRNKMLPGNPQLKVPNQYLRLTGTPLYLQRETAEWQSPVGKLRVAGVSSFGFGGANAHVILQEYNDARLAYTPDTNAEYVIPISAKSKERLLNQVANLESFIRSRPEENLAEIAYTLQVGRDPMPERLAIVASSRDMLLNKLSDFTNGNDSASYYVNADLQSDVTQYTTNNKETETRSAFSLKDLHALAQLWTQGYDIDWSLLYKKDQPKIISLPGYAFARERYWYDYRLSLGETGERTSKILSTSHSASHHHADIENENQLLPASHKNNSSTPGYEVVNIIPENINSEVQTTQKVKPMERDQVQSILVQLLADTLYTEPQLINADKKFIDMGLDSIIGVELIKSINQYFSLQLSATELYNYSTTVALSKFVYDNLPLQETKKTVHKVDLSVLSDTLFVPRKAPVSENGANHTQTKFDGGSNTAKSVATDIAVIGMSGVFPGSEDLEQFWQHLKSGKDLITEVPEERWDMRDFYDPDPKGKGKTNSKWMGVIDKVDRFDPLFFNIAPKEAELMDPQQRFFLEQSWKAIEDAGYNPRGLSGKRCGVFVGVSQGDYNSENLSPDDLNAYVLTGNSCSILSARISYFLNLKGPCITTDTSCSSALVAIAQACDSLVNGDSEIALAGGVCILTTPRLHILTGKAGMLSPQGRCHTFDQRANGFVPGEGIGIVVLKRLDLAQRDNDLIYGVIKGWGVNQDGSTNGITAPSDVSQSGLQKYVYDKFRIDPDTITYVEAHGTGTKLGDPIEVKALNESFRHYTRKTGYCGLGSVKSNIGHTLTAAGAAGFIKILLSLKYRQLPPTINYHTLNDHINLLESPFFINSSLSGWEAEPGQLRKAAINSFGFSGTNAHVVIEEYEQKQTVYNGEGAAIVILSAKNAERLKALAQQLEDHITRHPALNIFNIAFTLQTGREPMDERLAIIASSTTVLASRLCDFIAGNMDEIIAGNARKIKEDLGLADRDGEVYVAEAIKHRDVESLAQLWVNGFSVNWQVLYAENKPDRLRLPTYQFAKDRYWFNSYNNNGTLPKKPLKVKTSHMMSSIWHSESVIASLDHKINDLVKLDLSEEGIAIVQMNGRQSNNLLDRDMVLSLQKTFLELRTNTSVKAVVITGYENVFCMGGSEEALQDIANHRRKFSDAPFLYRGLLEFNVPVISAIQGHAFGGGLLFGLYADIVLLSDKGTYTANFMKYGFTPGMGATFILGEKLGKQLATEMMYTARLVSGATLKERSASVIVTENVMKEALKIARELSTKSRKALELLKATMSKKILSELQQHIEQEEIMHDETFHSNEVKQLIQGHFRKPSLQNPITTKPLLENGPVVSKKVSLARLDENVLQQQNKGGQFINMNGKADKPTVLQPLDSAKVSSVVVAVGNNHEDVSTVIVRLKKIFEEILHIPAHELDENAGFADIGVDSISGVEIIRQVNEAFDTSLEAIVLYDYHTLKKLGGLIAAQSNDIAYPVPVTTPPVSLTQQKVSAAITLEPLESNQHLPLSSSQVSLLTPRQDFPAVSRVSQTGHDVAVIGMSGRFPCAKNLDEFWNNLAQGRDCIGEVPSRKWDANKYYHTDKDLAGKTYGKWMGYLEDEDQFDALFFNISPREAERMDPQQRLFLQECWKAIEDAGYASASLSGSRCSVFVGAGQGDYIRHFNDEDLDSQVFTGISTSILASRISYYLNLKGAAISVDTACSSSLVAIHQACQTIISGESKMAIAGGVYVMTSEQMHIMTSKAGMLSEDGKCKTFDQQANGFVPGEGVGVVILKSLKDAEEDGDRIYGVIKSSGINQDGKTNGITAPSVEAQSSLETEVYRRHDINPDIITYVEAHGTATKLGDPIEIKALKEAFRNAGSSKTDFCALGSVKSNIGHTLSAAGVASAIKVLLSIMHKKLPPTINFSQLNEHINLNGSPFYVNTTLKDWTTEPGVPCTAAVSSFGFSGTNAHMVIQEYIPNAKAPYVPHTDAVILLSAKNRERLQEAVENLSRYIDANPKVSVHEIAYTLQTGRDSLEERLAMTVKNLDELYQSLSGYLQGRTALLITGNTKKDRLDFFLEGDAGKAYLETAVKNNQTRSLAQLWVKGVSIDWSLLYPHGKPDKISLPTYPFARKRYWVFSPAREVLSHENKKLHPLLHTNESDLNAQKYSSIYTGGERFLADHRVMNEKILPGVAYLELAREAGERSMQRKITQMKDVTWVSPIMINGSPRKVHISLNSSGDETSYEVYSGKDGEALVHSHGKLNTKSQPVPSPYDIGAIQQRMVMSKERQECYSLIKQRGLDLGTSFQGIEKIYYNREEALSRINLPEDESYVLIPGVLDSALQTCIGMSFARNDQTLALPFSVREVTFYRDIPSVAWSYARKSATAGRANMTYCDVDLLNDQGDVLLSFKDFLILPLNSGQKEQIIKAASKEIGAAEFLYKPVWERIRNVVPRHFEKGEKHVLITGMADDAMVEKIEMRLTKNGCVVEVFKGLNFLPDDTAHVYLLQGLSVDDSVFPARAAILNQELSVLDSVKKLTEFSGQELNVTVLTMNTQSVLANDVVSERGSGIVGLIGSFAKEKLNWNFRMIDLPGLVGEKDVEKLLAGPSNKEGAVIGYRNGHFYQRHLYPLNISSGKSALRSNGVYVIAGGAGGIGRVTTEYLVKKYNAQVIWLGRKPLDENITASMQAIQNLGTAPRYIQCDITNKESMEKAYLEVTQIFPVIHGVFHSAIVLKDMLTQNMTEDDFLQSFAPKSIGSHHLIDCFGKLPLDFVCFFSSVQSQINAHGQASYSAGCTYKDSFAYTVKQKKNIPSYIINWGYWGEVGVVSSQDYRDRMESFGVGSISPKEGMAILESVIGSNHTHVAAIKFTKK